MRLTRQCSICKEQFRKTELIEYSSITGKTKAWYCPNCLAEKQSRERFSNKVCQIFGIKSPGPIIWTQRKKLQKEYGYTDDAIINCLDYIYNVEKSQKLSETLVLVTPQSMERMRRWKARKDAESASIVAAIANIEMKEQVVKVAENKKEQKEISLDDGLFND